MDTDPDSRARTHLANERTFLAWFRTGITLIALGLAAAQFLTRNVDPDVPLVEILSTLVIGTGAAAVAIGLYHYRSGRRQIEELGFLPAGASITVAAGAGLILAVLGVIVVWLLRSS
jgi:putative membrane protein